VKEPQKSTHALCCLVDEWTLHNREQQNPCMNCAMITQWEAEAMTDMNVESCARYINCIIEVNDLLNWRPDLARRAGWRRSGR
jgi:hypothetical protein